MNKRLIPRHRPFSKKESYRPTRQTQNLPSLNESHSETARAFTITSICLGATGPSGSATISDRPSGQYRSSAESNRVVEQAFK